MRWPEYPAHDAFVAPAKKRCSLWMLFVGLCVATAAFIALNQLFYDTIYRISGDGSARLYQDLVAGATPLAMYIQLFTFGLIILAICLPVIFLHRRRLRTLFGAGRTFVGQFSATAVILVILSAAIFVLPPWDMGDPFIPNLAFSTWLVLLPLSLLAVLVQVSAEEILFRGYIQQQLAARFRSPWVWMVLPSALFGLGHYMPEAAGENALLIALWATVFGMLMADLTARSGTLGPAIAMHFINNVSAILIVSLPDGLSGLSLYLTPFALDDTAAMRAWLPVDFALMLVFWLAARLAIRR